MLLNDLGTDILDQIIYRGEGNSSIVVALKSHAKVIRLLKKDGKIMRTSQDHHVTQHPMRSIKFIHLIMKPLTDPFLSGTTELIHLKSDFINRLSKTVEVYRPLHRLDKTLHLDDQYALVMDDLCTLPPQLTNQLHYDDLCGPTISVEIKPKQGFLPIYRHLMKPSDNDNLASILRSYCLYGSTQYLKLARGRINQPSNYCPLNLFSGCPVRMKYALEELIKNPQNNLRIFEDLVLAYGENKQVKLANVLDNFFECEQDSKESIRNQERFVGLLIQCLLNNRDKKDTESSQPKLDHENFSYCSDICLQHCPKTRCKRCDSHPSCKKYRKDSYNSIHRLPRSCVLACVLRAQRLDSIGAHEALYMLEWLLENSNYSRKAEILEELSKPQLPNGFGSMHQLPDESKQQYYFRKVWEFLVSLTAKDCSIIVTLRRISNSCYKSIVEGRACIEDHLLKDSRSDSCYLFNVGIADLDQKMPLKIARICDNLNLILQAKGEYIRTETQCQQASQKVMINVI